MERRCEMTGFTTYYVAVNRDNTQPLTADELDDTDCDDDDDEEILCTQCGKPTDGADYGIYEVSASGIIHKPLCISCAMNEVTVGEEDNEKGSDEDEEEILLDSERGIDRECEPVSPDE